MSDIDDVKTEAKATRFQKILDKLELIDKKLDELTNKPKQYNKPMDKGNDASAEASRGIRDDVKASSG